MKGTLREAGWGAAMGYPGLDLDESGQRIEGFVFSSDALADHWARLDAFEGDAYSRVATTVQPASGTAVQAYLYVLKGI